MKNPRACLPTEGRHEGMEEFPHYPYTIPVTPRDYSEIRGQPYPLYEWRHQETANVDVWVPPGYPLLSFLVSSYYDDPMEKYKDVYANEQEADEVMAMIDETLIGTPEQLIISGSDTELTTAFYKIWKGEPRPPLGNYTKEGMSLLDAYKYAALLFAYKTAVRKSEAKYLYSIIDDLYPRRRFLEILLYYHSGVTEQDLKDIGFSDSEIFNVLISNPLDDRYQSIMDRLLPTFLSNVDTVWKYKNVSRRVRPEEVAPNIRLSEIKRFWEMLSPSERSLVAPVLDLNQKLLIQ